MQVARLPARFSVTALHGRGRGAPSRTAQSSWWLRTIRSLVPGILVSTARSADRAGLVERSRCGVLLASDDEPSARRSTVAVYQGANWALPANPRA